MLRAADGRLRRPGAPAAVLGVLTAVYMAVVSRIQIDIHRGLGTSSYDIGLYDQGLWLLSRFEAPFVTLMGRNLLGDHASIILLPVVPLYWVLPGAETLIVLQTVVIALGAWPLFLWARRHLASQWQACVLASLWFINPAVVWTNFENYHPDSFLGLFIPMALWGALSQRWWVYAAGVVLAMAVKEDALLILVPLGIFVALSRDRRMGIVTVLASVAATLAGMFLMMRSLIGVPTRNTWRIPFGGPSGLVRTTFTDPVALWRHISSEGRLFYLWQLTAPFAGLFAFAPRIAAISILVVTANIVSTFWYQFQIEYHYTLVIVPALAFATVAAIAKVGRRWRPLLVSCVASATVVSALAWGPWWFTESPRYYWKHDHPVATAAREIVARVPDGDSVSAYHSLAPHLTLRREIFQFPTPFRSVLYGVDASEEGARLPAAETVRWVVLPVVRDAQMNADWEAERWAFELVVANQYWELYQRTFAATGLDSHGGSR